MRFSILGTLPLDTPGSAEHIAGWRDQPGMLGLRDWFLHEPNRTWLAEGAIDWLWAAAEDAGVPVSMLATDSLEAIVRHFFVPHFPLIPGASAEKET